VLRRDILGDDSACADYDVVADLNIPEQARAGTDEDPVPDNGGIFAYYPRPERPIADRHVLKDDGISLEHRLSIDGDAESVMHKADAVIHHDLWGEITGIPSAQPSLNNLSDLGAAAVVETTGKSPHSVITSVH